VDVSVNNITNLKKKFDSFYLLYMGYIKPKKPSQATVPLEEVSAGFFENNCQFQLLFREQQELQKNCGIILCHYHFNYRQIG
jgi:hypothetical protein